MLSYFGARMRSSGAFRGASCTIRYLLGNYPRIEIIFGCVDKSASVAASTESDPNYSKLLNLKKLSDAGVISQQEFEREKGKVLSQP
jgi:hypothetical protein